jgi:hypothetical protein
MATASICTGPTRVDWGCVRAGDRNVVRFELLAGGSPWNLAGAVLSAQARTEAVSEEVALTATIVEVDPSRGWYDVGWDGEDVRSLLAGAASWSGVWDLQVVEAEQVLATTVVHGTLSAEMDVTRDA